MTDSAKRFMYLLLLCVWFTHMEPGAGGALRHNGDGDGARRKHSTLGEAPSETSPGFRGTPESPGDLWDSVGLCEDSAGLRGTPNGSGGLRWTPQGLRKTP